MPKIPFLSNFSISELLKSVEVDYSEIEEEDDDEDKEYVTQIERSRNGNDSPATILTRWMNKVAKWEEKDIIKNTNGDIDKVKFRMLLKDSKSAWEDEDAINSLALITGSSPDDWKRAWENYSGEGIEN